MESVPAQGICLSGENPAPSRTTIFYGLAALQLALQLMGEFYKCL